MTIQELRELLDYGIVRAREYHAYIKDMAPNSYGSGYYQGIVYALQHVLNTINGEEDDTLDDLL